MSLAADWETEDKGETISSTSTQDFDREKVEREFITWPLIISRSERVSRNW